MPARSLGFLLALAFAASCPSLGWSEAASAAQSDDKGRDPDLFAREMAAYKRKEAERKAEARSERDRETQALRLSGPPAACVAYDPARDSCLITIEDFNREAETRPMRPRGVPGASGDAERATARRNLLASLLGPAYLEFRISLSGKSDSLARLVARAGKRGLPDAGDKEAEADLRKRYRAWYPRLFQPREDIAVEAIGAGDSALADSLRLLLSRKAPAADSAALAGKSPFAWQDVPTAALPQAALEGLDRMPRGETMGPVRTPFGFLLLRWKSRRRLPGIAYEDALPSLPQLPSDTAAAALDFRNLAREWYRNHPQGLTAPDTTYFRAWLSPSPATKPSAEATATARVSIPDTLRSPLRLRFQDLPEQVQGRLGRYRSIHPGDFLGPIPSAFGTWYLSVSGIRPGGRRLEFAEAYPRVLQILYGPGATDPPQAAMRRVQAREKSIWDQVAWNYLVQSQDGDKVAADREAWIRGQLDIRFVAAPGLP
jgi:hypothetical protein